jgi:hypothetical protein
MNDIEKTGEGQNEPIELIKPDYHTDQNGVMTYLGSDIDTRRTNNLEPSSKWLNSRTGKLLRGAAFVAVTGTIGSEIAVNVFDIDRNIGAYIGPAIVAYYIIKEN